MDVTPFHRGLYMLSLPDAPEEAVKEGGEIPGFSTQAKSACSQQQSTLELQRGKAFLLDECVVIGETTAIGCHEITSGLLSHLATEQDIQEINTSRGSICSSVPSFADSDWSAASSQLLDSEPLQFPGYDLPRVETPRKEDFSFREEWLQATKERGCSPPPISQTRIQDLRNAHSRHPKKIKRLPPRRVGPKRKTWYCWVENCSESRTSFETLEERLDHYECNHADMILQCRIPKCRSQKFVREADRAKHMTVVHAEEDLETILRNYEKSECDGENGEGEKTTESSTFPEDGETTVFESSRAIRKRAGSPIMGSPALVPRISHCIKTSTPEPENLAEDAPSLLLASRSNYQNILEGTHVPGVTYPSELSTDLTSKRNYQKSVEQGRRSRINSALQGITTLLPRGMKDGSKTSKKPPVNEQDHFVDGSVSEPSSASEDPSDAFSTDSSWSDEYDECDVISDVISAEYQNPTPDAGQRMAGISSVLTPVKSTLVEKLMKEFWEVVNDDWSFIPVRRRGGGSPDSSQSTSATTPSNEAATKKQSIGDDNKRPRSNGEGDIPDDGEGRSPKRRKGTVLTPDESTRVRFACPYRKHDPRRYSHNNQYSHNNRCWKTCALTGYQDISRIKTHLYRAHRIFQCRRCKELFANSEKLDAHGLEAKACSLKQSDPEEGITETIEKKLRNRKKAHRNQSEAERWQEIYKVLFPEEEPPDPYFEPPQDEIVNSPNVVELSNYEEFSRRELPRIFRSTLEEAVTNEVEEQLRTRLIDMIQQCQDQVFSMYRGSRGISTASGASFHSDTQDLSQETPNSQRPEAGLRQESQIRPPSHNVANVGATTVDAPSGTMEETHSEEEEDPLVPTSQPGNSEQISVEHTPRNNPNNVFGQPAELFKSIENNGQYEGLENIEARQMQDQQVGDDYSDILFGDLDFFSPSAELGSTIGGMNSGYWRNEGIPTQYGELENKCL